MTMLKICITIWLGCGFLGAISLVCLFLFNVGELMFKVTWTIFGLGTFGAIAGTLLWAVWS